MLDPYELRGHVAMRTRPAPPFTPIMAHSASSPRLVHALSLDVEDYVHAHALEPWIGSARWADWPSRVEESTARVLDLVEACGGRLTCFVLGWVAERHPGLVREIARRGHEIATHGYAHRLVYTQTPAQFRSDVERSRDLLQDLTGQPVVGYRAPSFSITRQCWWALEVLLDLGFRYDSSIVPITGHDRYGVRHAPAVPWRYGSLWEIPISTIAIGRLRLPLGGGAYFRFFPYWLTRWGLSQLERRGRPAVLYFHPWEFDPDQPRVPAAFLSRLRHYTNLHQTAGRFTRLCQEFAFAPFSQVFAALFAGEEDAYLSGDSGRTTLSAPRG